MVYNSMWLIYHDAKLAFFDMKDGTLINTLALRQCGAKKISLVKSQIKLIIADLNWFFLGSEAERWSPWCRTKVWVSRDQLLEFRNQQKYHRAGDRRWWKNGRKSEIDISAIFKLDLKMQLYWERKCFWHCPFALSVRNFALLHSFGRKKLPFPEKRS